MSSFTAADYEPVTWEPPPDPPKLYATTVGGGRSTVSVSRLFSAGGCRMFEEMLRELAAPGSTLTNDLTAGLGTADAQRLRSLLAWKRSRDDHGRWELSLTPEHDLVRRVPIPAHLTLTALTVQLRPHNDTLETSFELKTTGERALSADEQQRASSAAAPLSYWAVNHLVCAVVARELVPQIERLAREETVSAQVRQKIEVGQRTEASTQSVQAPYVHRVSAFVSHSAF